MPKPNRTRPWLAVVNCDPRETIGLSIHFWLTKANSGPSFSSCAVHARLHYVFKIWKWAGSEIARKWVKGVSVHHLHILYVSNALFPDDAPHLDPRDYHWFLLFRIVASISLISEVRGRSGLATWHIYCSHMGNWSALKKWYVLTIRQVNIGFLLTPSPFLVHW